jgi:hypothetical protein
VRSPFSLLFPQLFIIAFYLHKESPVLHIMVPCRHIQFRNHSVVLGKFRNPEIEKRLLRAKVEVSPTLRLAR